jgi:ABC-type sulfate transport system permease component
MTKKQMLVIPLMLLLFFVVFFIERFLLLQTGILGNCSLMLVTDDPSCTQKIKIGQYISEATFFGMVALTLILLYVFRKKRSPVKPSKQTTIR